MSLECSECERDLRGGHDPSCSRYPGEPPECTCTFRLQGMDDHQHQNECAVTKWQDEPRSQPPQRPRGTKTGIYTASKVIHSGMWLSLRHRGWPIISTWIDEAGEGESSSLEDLWVRCVREAAGAAVVILYREPGEVLKGALVEVGAALASGVPVLVVGEVDASWVNHPLVKRLPSLGGPDGALAACRRMGCSDLKGKP